MAKKEETMTLLEHLGELRKRLTLVVVVNFVAMIILFSKTEDIMSYLLNVNPGLELVYISPSELLAVYIKTAFIMAIVVCSPITFYQIWAFIEQGLYKNEKIYVGITLIFGAILFVLGVLFCYFLVLPTTLQFFLRIAIEEVNSMISIDSYVSFVNMILLSFGIVFELPVVVFLLTKLGILKPKFLKKNRAIIIVAIFIVAAFITPPDVISQIMLGVPLMLLMEISIFISTFVDKLNRKNKETNG